MAEELQPIEEFDFDVHRRVAIEQYQKIRSVYEEFSDVIEKILLETIRDQTIKVASVESRAKDLENFGIKAATPEDSNTEKPKYPNPVDDITDLAAARVITFFLKDVEAIDSLIGDEFEVLERSDKAELLAEDAKVGYLSVHYIVRLLPNRTNLPEYSRFDDLKAEIQLRTVLQHAWAEIEHDIQYKSLETIPSEIRRRFTSLAGLLEIADREFQAVQEEDERLRQEARRSVEEGKLDQVEITGDALRAYLDQKLGFDGRMAEGSYEWMAGLTRRLGFSNFSQIDSVIAAYDDDKLSRIMWGNRQGQLSRFEDMIFAAMGGKFIERHPFSNELWWHNIRTIRLKRVHDSGVKTGWYLPEIENEPKSTQDNAS